MARYARVSNAQRGDDGRFSDMHPDEQRVLSDWIRKFFRPDSRPDINRKVTAYGLKHLFGNSEFGFYVYSRELAEAMERAGFQSTSTEWGDWYFNVDPADVRKAERSARYLERVAFGSSNPQVHSSAVVVSGQRWL